MRFLFFVALLFTTTVSAEEIKPITNGKEGRRAFDDLSTFYSNHKSTPPYQAALKNVNSSNKLKQQRSGRYLLALLQQSFADEKNGRAQWHRLISWGGGSENIARIFRSDLAKALGAKASGNEALPGIKWLIKNETQTKNQTYGIQALRKIKGESANKLIMDVLKNTHPHATVLHGAILEVGARKISSAAPALKSLCQHYRKKIRLAAIKSYKIFDLGSVSDYSPNKAFTSIIRTWLKSIGGIINTTIPDNASWHVFWITVPPVVGQKKTRTYTINGWLLSQTENNVHILDWFAKEHHILKGQVQIKEKQTWKQLANKLTSIRKEEYPMEKLSRRGGLTAQFEPRSISLPEALIAAWAFAKGDKKSAATILFPRLETTTDDRLVKRAVRDLLGDLYFQKLLISFSHYRDYPEALKLARHLTHPFFNGYPNQDRAKEFVAQLTTRYEDFKTLVLPNAIAWNKQTKTLSRLEQIKFLTERLRLLNCFQWSQPGGVNYMDEQFAKSRIEPTNSNTNNRTTVINPYHELWSMELDIMEIQTLIHLLADENFMLIFSYWRDFHPSRTLHRVQWVVRNIINDAAKHDLAQMEHYRRLDNAEKKLHLKAILDWCVKNRTKSRSELLLDSMRTAKDWRHFSRAAGEAVQKRVKTILPILVNRIKDFPEKQSEIAELVFAMNTKESILQAREWLSREDEGIRFWAALILLRLGKTDELEGLNTLREILANDDGSNWYPRAIRTLTATRKEAAVKLACGILKKNEFSYTDYNARSILLRLLLLGRNEALQYMIKGLENKKEWGTTSGTWKTKEVDITIFEFDEMASLVSDLAKMEMVYELLAPKSERFKRCRELQGWLRKQFKLIQHKKPHELDMEIQELHFSRWQVDAP